MQSESKLSTHLIEVKAKWQTGILAHTLSVTANGSLTSH